MIKAGNTYEEDAIRFFMQAYGVKPDPYTVVIVRKAGMSQTDGLTVPKDKKQYVIFLSPSASGAELIRLIAHEVAHVCQIIKGDLEFANVGGNIKVYWHDEEVNVDKTPYRKRPWEVEAYTLEKKYVHDFVNKYGNQMQERLVHQDGEWVLLAKSSDRVLKKFGKTKPSEEAVKKEEARIQSFKHMKEEKMKTFEDYIELAENGNIAQTLQQFNLAWADQIKQFNSSLNYDAARLSAAEYKEYIKEVKNFVKTTQNLSRLLTSAMIARK